MEAVNGSGNEIQREAIIETAGSWVCPECKTPNNPNTFHDEQSREHCHECGATMPALEDDIVVPDSLAELGVTANGIKALAGGLAEHANNAHEAEQVENPDSKPSDVALPLEGEEQTGESFERFNANAAMSAIISKNREVEVSRAAWKDAKQEAADAKKALDEDEAALAKLITHFEQAREQQNSPQSFLPLDGAAGPAAVDSNCPWERAHPGMVCIVCREAKKAKLSPVETSNVHPEHEGHQQVARDGHTETVIKPLIPKLEAKGLHVQILDVMDLEADELQQLLDWADATGIIPPAIVATSHVAAAAGSIAQVCSNCDTLLADAKDEEGFYPEGARVGLDCDAKLEEVVNEAERVEDSPPVKEAAVRKPRSHAKKATTKRREPEKEHAEQVKAAKRVAGTAAPYKPKKAAPKHAAKKGRRK